LFGAAEDIWALGDINRDSIIDDKDVALMVELFETDDPRADFNSNGIVDMQDVTILVKNYGLDRRGGAVIKRIGDIMNFAVEPLGKAVTGLLTTIPKAVWDYATNVLEQQIREFEEAHPEVK